MRLTISLFAILAMPLAIASCSDTSSLTVTPKDMAVAPPDLSVPMDFAIAPDFAKKPVPPDMTVPRDFAGVNCGNMTCAMGLVCCASQGGGGLMEACATSCDKDAGMYTLACDGPEDCNGHYCCVTIANNNGKFDTNGAACQNDCMTNFSNNGGQTRLCHSDADCANNGFYGNCCHANGQPGQFCAIPIMQGGFDIQCP